MRQLRLGLLGIDDGLGDLGFEVFGVAFSHAVNLEPEGLLRDAGFSRDFGVGRGVFPERQEFAQMLEFVEIVALGEFPAQAFGGRLEESLGPGAFKKTGGIGDVARFPRIATLGGGFVEGEGRKAAAPFRGGPVPEAVFDELTQQVEDEGAQPPLFPPRGLDGFAGDERTEEILGEVLGIRRGKAVAPGEGVDRGTNTGGRFPPWRRGRRFRRPAAPCGSGSNWWWGTSRTVFPARTAGDRSCEKIFPSE